MLVVVSKIINKVKVCGMFLFQIGVLYPVSLFLSPLYKEHLCSPNTQMSALYVVWENTKATTKGTGYRELNTIE